MSAVGLTLWSQGLACCRTEYDSSTKTYDLRFEFISAAGFGDASSCEVAEEILKALTLSRGAKYLVVSYRPTRPDTAPYWDALRRAIDAVCSKARVIVTTHDQRLQAVYGATGRDLTAEAIKSLKGQGITLSATAAMQYGCRDNALLFEQQGSLMKQAARIFLQSSKCNSSSQNSAYQQYQELLRAARGGWFPENTLWQAVYGAMESKKHQQQREQQQRRAERQRRRQQRWEQQQQRREERDRQRQQEKWDRQRQQERQQRRVDKVWAELSADAPDVDKMSTEEIQDFLQQMGVTANNLYDLKMDQLLLLAKHAVRLWEAKRVARCGKYIRHQQTTVAKKYCAQLLFRLGIRDGSSVGFTAPAAAGFTASELKKAYRGLALVVHPDKAPTGFEEFKVVFEDGFKALQQAYELLCKG